MARSVYFGQNVQSEKNLYEDLIIESIKVYGFDMFYLPRAIVSQDKVLNEDTETQFNSAYEIEMYIETVEGYEGDGVLMSKFGLELRNQLKVIVSRRRWNSTVGTWNSGYNNYRPSEGDLIYIPGIKGLFEIKYVDLETPFHQLNNLPVYRMTLELFEYRGEDMNTGIDQVDALQAEKSLDSSYRAVVTYSNQTIKFNIEEPITLAYASGATGTAKVTNIQLSDPLNSNSTTTITFSALRFMDSTIHPLASGVIATGMITGAVATITHVVTLTDGDEALNDGDISIQNNALETRANSITDFTEVNPFGESNDS
jgi:hypothetical protein